MQGFDASGALVATDSVTTRDWSQLVLNSLDPIQHVLLTESSKDPNLGNLFMYDDLRVGSVPEPSGLTLLGLGVLALIGLASNRLRNQ